MKSACVIPAIVILVLVSICAIGCSSAPVKNTQPSSTAEATPTATPATEVKNWVASEKTNPMDNAKEIMLLADATNKSGAFLIVRFKGKSLDVYVNTNEIVDDESSHVRIKFDSGNPLAQTWSRSTDYKAVFSPDPFALLTKLQSSSKFYIEYRPYQKVADTIIFDVAGLSAALPQEQMAEQKKKREASSAATAALRARIQPHVHLCKAETYEGKPLFPGQWCWSDPNDALFSSESSPSDTKEEAIKSAMDMARFGLVFKK